MARSCRRPALVAGFTALLLCMPATALAQPAHPAPPSPSHRAAIVRVWERIHKIRNMPTPAWAAGKGRRAAPGTVPVGLAAGGRRHALVLQRLGGGHGVCVRLRQ